MPCVHLARSIMIAALTCIGLGLLADPVWAAVGRTEAAYGVTQNGAASYAIPIRVTEGIGGLKPQLAISYTGPGQRTILGVGFQLAGLSYITPCRKTIAQDLNAAPVTLTSADRYCLDGARLRGVTGTYGASGATYRTELDQMARVTSNNSSNGIPGWFKVETRDGLIFEYGNTTDSKLLASGTASAPPQFWAVNKISDRAGNSMAFVYDTNNSLRRFRPNYILYTASNAGAARYKVSFVYQSTSQPEPTLDFTPSAAGGAAQSDDKLLDRIELLHDSTVYRKVLFTYQQGAGVNKRLLTVQECVPGAPDDCLPATTLSWQSAAPGHGSAVASNTVASGVMALDLNGDGFEDLAFASGGTWRYMLGGASGYGAVLNSTVTVTNASKAMPLEWNGDGFEDLLIDWSDGKWRVLKGSASGLATSPVQAGSGAGTSSNVANTTWTIADTNGDGRDDLLSMTVVDPQLTIKIYIHDSIGFGAPTTAYNSNFLGNGGYGSFTGMSAASATRQPDFNGDGRDDLVINGCSQFEYDGPYVWCIDNGWYQLNSNGTTYSTVGNLAYSSDSVPDRYGDFNGDGLTDVVYPAYAPGQWYLGYGQGSGAVSTAAGPSFAGHATYQTMVGDYDGDGYDDLYVTTNSPWQWSVFRGTGTGLSTTPIATGMSGSGLGWMLTDFNGDGLKDMARYDSASFVWSTFAHLGLPGERLTSATDGLGNGVSFSYLPMTDSTVYTKGTTGTYPTPDLQFATPLVHTMQVAPGGGTPFTMTYSYANARTSYLYRTYLGMGTRAVTDDRKVNDIGVVTTEIFSQEFPYVGAPTTVTVKQSNGGATIQEVMHTYASYQLDTTPGNQRFLPYRSHSVTKIYEVGGVKNGSQITESTEDHTVDALGNSTLVWAETKDMNAGSPDNGSVWRTEVTSTYLENQSTWCVATPLTRSDKRILPGGANETRATSWTVAATECRVTQEIVEPGAGGTPPLSLITDLVYDSCGNVNSISSYPAGTSGQQRTTTIGYGTRCQRPETITNPEGHVSTIAYSWPLALPSAQTDPNGIALNLEYDSFGRLTRQLRPDGTAARFALTACTSGNSWCGKNSSARLKVTRTERNTADSLLRTDEQFLDGLGRLRWSHSDSLESGPAIVETLYDAFGRPSQQTQPYFTGNPVYATSYARDLVGRVTEINAPIDEANPSGRITGFRYEGRDFAITDPKTFTTTRRSNAIGQLRAVTDPSPGGITNYAYHPFGELAAITDAASNVTSWTYNQRGFVTGTSDPDAGSWTYVPNAFGELTSQTDAKNQITTFTYDRLSRPKTRTDVAPAGTTNWTWGNSAASKNIGQLASITSPGSYAEAYSFDTLGRLNQQSVTADATTYYINLTYQAQTGLLDTLQYPTSTSGYRLKLAYDYSNNLLQKVRDFNGSTIFWQATSTDAYGHIQDETFGNGILTFTDFDQASGLMAAREGGIGGGTGLINSAVDWDLNGNLWHRSDSKLSPAVSEEFIYDSLNRFDESKRTVGTGTPTTNANVTLDEIGNINWKSGVGDYAYHATQKRAVISAGGFNFGYDANGNMTSRNGSSIGYTSYNLPSVINAGSSSSAISYGAFRNRYKQVSSGSVAETTIYVAGLLERVTRSSVTEYRHLIHGGQGVAAVYTRRTSGNPLTDTYYVHSDHLGSPELLTNASGGVVVRLSFGAYGERRDGSDWDGAVSSGDLTAIGNTGRHGFTGHEHLDAVGLIHMNGRVYEPVAGRFLSRDPIIDGFASSQGPNGFAYVHNNPLTYVDPSGFDAVTNEQAMHYDFGAFAFFNLRGSILDEWSQDLTAAQGGGVAIIPPGLPRASWPATVAGGRDGFISGGSGVMYGVTIATRSSQAVQPITGTFTAPTVLGAGSVSIDFFIAAESALGLAGDARGYDAAPNPSNSRVSIFLDFEKGRGTFQINPTCTVGGTCKAPIPIGSGNSFETRIVGNTIVVTGSIKNSKYPFSPSLDFAINVRGSPGRVSFNGLRNAFPSVEIASGSTFLYRGAESNPLGLLDGMPMSTVLFSGP